MLFKFIGRNDPESYNVLNPYFLPFHFLNINRRMFRNVNGLFLKALLGILKIILTPILILITFFINLICLFLNYFDIDETFTSGYTLLAQKVNDERDYL